MSESPLLLLVDDEESFREIFKAKFSQAKFVVETAESGREGIKKAKELKPDLILMDVKMPEMDGIEAFTRLKEDRETRKCDVIFLTAFGNFGEEIQQLNDRFAQEIGAAGYIRKTDDFDAIVSKVWEFLKSKQ